jgi:glutathione synthase/RimK-type ligase-like ATP-grasp enzyme
MTRTIGTLGYVGRPEFAFDCPVDEDQITSMLAARDDRIVMAHWDDLDAKALMARAWEVRRGEWLTWDYGRCDALLILEAPAPGSKNADFGHTEAAMREVLRRGIPAVNSMRTFLEYPDKRYLVDRPDLPFPKTALVTNHTDLRPLLADLPAEVVLKPLIGAGGKGVVRLPRDADALRAAMEPGREYLLQPFLPEIMDGERCLYFLAKRFRYALVKRPKPGEFRTNEGMAIYERYEPTAEELSLAEDVIRRFASPSLIERVDICGRYVMEMTIECPGLKIKVAEVQREIGIWTYESLDMAIENAGRGVT